MAPRSPHAVTRLLDGLAALMRRHMDAEAQLRMWLLIWLACWPLYPVGMLLPGSWLSRFIYWLSVLALHLAAMGGVTTAETLVQVDTDPDLQTVAEEVTED